MSDPIRVLFHSPLPATDPPDDGAGLRIALFQGQGEVGSRTAVEANLRRMADAASLAADYRCHLCVFPESYVTGYALTPEQCAELAEPSTGPCIRRAQQVALHHEMALVLPFAERADTAVHDAVAVIAPDGTLLTVYRKTHLYGAAERRMYTPGDNLPPLFHINGVAAGALNCYECEFPPLYQYLAEQGARIVIGPTAADRHFRLVDGRMTQVPYPDATEHIIPAMAAIWRLFVAYANRRGWEQTADAGWDYRGNSGVWAPNGEPVVTAGPHDQDADCLLIADCLPAQIPPFSPEGNHLTDNRLHLAPGLLRPRP